MTSVKSSNRIPAKSPSEEQLLRLTAQGDRAAMEELYRRTRAEIYALALSTLKNREDAQDVLQDVFVSLFKSAEAFRGEGSARSYLLSITLKQCRMKLRQNTRRADLDEEDWLPLLEDRASLSPYELTLIKECMAALDQEERQILVLHAVSGLKHREIAGVLRKPLSTVLSKYNRAVKKLQNKFGKGDEYVPQN